MELRRTRAVGEPRRLEEVPHKAEVPHKQEGVLRKLEVEPHTQGEGSAMGEGPGLAGEEPHAPKGAAGCSSSSNRSWPSFLVFCLLRAVMHLGQACASMRPSRKVHRMLTGPGLCPCSCFW